VANRNIHASVGQFTMREVWDSESRMVISLLEPSEVPELVSDFRLCAYPVESVLHSCQSPALVPKPQGPSSANLRFLKVHELDVPSCEPLRHALCLLKASLRKLYSVKSSDRNLLHERQVIQNIHLLHMPQERFFVFLSGVTSSVYAQRLNRVLHDLRAAMNHGMKRPERQSERIERVGQKFGLDLKLAAGQSKTVKVGERIELAAAGWRRRVDVKKLHQTGIVLSHSNFVAGSAIATILHHPTRRRIYSCTPS
jgi:hypothetical protein